MYPATLEQMKAFCKVDHDFEDELFTDAYAPSALRYMVDATGATKAELNAMPESRQPFLMLVRANYAPDERAGDYREGADQLLWRMSIERQNRLQGTCVPDGSRSGS